MSDQKDGWKKEKIGRRKNWAQNSKRIDGRRKNWEKKELGAEQKRGMLL